MKPNYEISQDDMIHVLRIHGKMFSSGHPTLVHAWTQISKACPHIEAGLLQIPTLKEQGARALSAIEDLLIEQGILTRPKRCP